MRLRILLHLVTARYERGEKDNTVIEVKERPARTLEREISNNQTNEPREKSAMTTNERSLEVYQGPTALSVTDLPDPDAVLEFQTKAAKALMRVVEQQGEDNKLVHNIQGKRYLGFEAWQTIAGFNGCSVQIESTHEIREDGELVAIGAWAIVVDGAGTTRSRAHMECGLDSFPTRGREGREKYKAAESTAQTWAGSKACRMAFSFVAVLAGFQPTTAEEMMGQADATGLKCPEHGVAFFQSGRMRGPAHRNDNGSWCNFDPAMFRPQIGATIATIGWESPNEQVNALIDTEFGVSFGNLNLEQVGTLLTRLDELASEAPDDASEPPGAAVRPEQPALEVPEAPEAAQA